MSNNYVNSVKYLSPLSLPLPGRSSEMVKNSSGACSFKVDIWGHLERFLILGTSEPTYYASAEQLTIEAAASVLDCIKLDGLKTVKNITEISVSGRAPKNDAAIFALALCAINGNEETVKAAYAVLPSVARTGTHLFQFVTAIDTLGKWNAATKRGIAAWYQNKDTDHLLVQLLKYQQRNGWSHRDVIRLAHVKPHSDTMSSIFKYVTSGPAAIEQGTMMPQFLIDFEMLKGADSIKSATDIINSNKLLTWEMVPTKFHKSVRIWDALLPQMGMTAIIRKLGQLTSIGLFSDNSNATKYVCELFRSPAQIKKAKIHPLTILNALKQYKRGKGLKGSLSWKPVASIIQCLQAAFYESFNYVESTGENYLIGVDCSSSMGFDKAGGTDLTSREIAGVMALVIAKCEKNCWIGGFNTSIAKLDIDASMTYEQVLNVMKCFSWGGTNCSAPIEYAIKNDMKIDKFVILTDNDTNYGRHPVAVLNEYRNKMQIDAKLIVAAFTATKFTIADPHDSGMLDICGFDSSIPQLIQTF